MKSIFMVDTESLKQLNERSCDLSYHHTLGKRVEDMLDDDGTHVLSVIMFHEHIAAKRVLPHYRCKAFIKLKGQKDAYVQLFDCDIEWLDSLSTSFITPTFTEAEA